MKMTITIRRAGIHDIPAIQRLYRQLDAYHAVLLPAVFQPLEDDARGDSVIRKWIERDDADYLLAESEGQVIGFVNIQRASPPDYPMYRPQEYAVIDDAVVIEAHRGKGSGSALFRAAMEWAGDRGLRHVHTTVWHENTVARDFYLDRGFRPILVRLELDTEKYDAM